MLSMSDASAIFLVEPSLYRMVMLSSAGSYMFFSIPGVEMKYPASDGEMSNCLPICKVISFFRSSPKGSVEISTLKMLRFIMPRLSVDSTLSACVLHTFRDVHRSLSSNWMKFSKHSGLA